MNNRYLCRAKRTDNGEWVEGYIVVYPSGRCNIHKKCTEPPDVLAIYEIDPSTICQCTGLKDKNGKLIWENDILVGYIDDMYQEDATYTRVIWNKNGFYTKEKGSYDILPLDEFDEKHFEVCGNIFDNPELLESKGCD